MGIWRMSSKFEQLYYCMRPRSINLIDPLNPIVTINIVPVTDGNKKVFCISLTKKGITDSLTKFTYLDIWEGGNFRVQFGICSRWEKGQYDPIILSPLNHHNLRNGVAWMRVARKIIGEEMWN